jgi:alanine dehydrogenase
MIIGVPKETKSGENRVALTPATARALTADGHQVLVEARAGEQSGIGDHEYHVHGAEVADTARDVWAHADLVVKVKEPQVDEFALLRPGQILFTYLHLASARSVTEALLEHRVTGIGYETVQRPDGSLPLLTPMSEIAGKMATQIGARLLEAHAGGRGILMGGVPGVPPADVAILGCGTVGLNAAKVAMGMGAAVTILDVNHDRLRYLEEILHGNAITVYSDPHTIERACRYADLLIGCVLIPGARAPKLVTRDMVERMKARTAIVDVAVDQGGCVETIHPTSHNRPTFVEHNVIHYGVPNMPAAVPRTSTFALSNATAPYVRAIANRGLDAALEHDEALRRGLNTRDGKLVHPAVQEAFPDLA